MSEFIYYDCLNPIQVELDLRGFPYPVRVGFQRMVKESEYAALRQQLATAHAALRDQVARLTAERTCTICNKETDIACSDCRVDLRTTVYVCSLRACQLAHEKKCPGNLQQQLARYRTALEQIRDNTLVDAEPPELRAQNECNLRYAAQGLNKESL